MRSVHQFVVKPKGDRYNNKKKIGDKELVFNTEIQNHQYVNREAEVISVPIGKESDIEPGDTIILHHNVFRRWHNIRGEEKNSKSYFDENKYIITEDRIFLYKKNNEWLATEGYCFVKPIKEKDFFEFGPEKPLVGIVKYTDGSVDVDDLVGFAPNSEYEFIIDGERLYRVLSNFITIKYEYQGDEEAYNPSWAQSR